jgi:hypothetical protein
MIAKLLKKTPFWIALIVAIEATLFIPASQTKFWWIDDGWSIQMAQKVLSAIHSFNLGNLNFILSEEGGRLRTIYWLYQTMVYAIGGTNPQIHFFIHHLVILGGAIFIFLIVKKISKSNFSGFFAATLYILTPMNTENIYRLGPIEPILALFIVASLYFLLNENLATSIVFLFLATFVKETGFVVWLPVLVAYIFKRLILKKRDRLFEKYCIWGFLFFLPVIISTTLRRSGYSTFYVINFGSIVGNSYSYLRLILGTTMPLILLFGLTFLIRLFSYFKTNSVGKHIKSLIPEFIFILFFVFYIIIQSPWMYVMYRYIMPFSIGLVVFLGVEFGEIEKFLIKHKYWINKAIYVAFIAYFLVSVGENIIRIYKVEENFAFTTTSIQNFFSYLANNVPANGTVLYNFIPGDSTMELVAETKIHLNLLYSRPDINIGYLDLGKLPSSSYLIVGTPMISEEYSKDAILNSIKNIKLENGITNEKSFLVITTPDNLVKQVIKKIIGLVKNKEPFTGDGIYTYYVNKDYWYKYNVKNTN